eukprot:3231683-Amphidinium_carterae.1
MLGDWNATPQEVEATGFLAASGMVMLATHRSTASREIDYGLVSANMAQWVRSCRLHDTTVLATHWPVRVVVGRLANNARVPVRVRRQPLPERRPIGPAKRFVSDWTTSVADVMGSW